MFFQPPRAAYSARASPSIRVWGWVWKTKGWPKSMVALWVPLIALKSGTPYCFATGLMAMNTELEHTPVRRSTFSERMRSRACLAPSSGLVLESRQMISIGRPSTPPAPLISACAISIALRAEWVRPPQAPEMPPT